MPPENNAGKTRLTESQARALASWWRGRYLRLESRHGVLLPLAPESRSAIYFWEDAQLVEQRRTDVNPAAADWVG